MKYYIIAISLLLYSCGSSTDTTIKTTHVDPHAGHNHGPMEEVKPVEDTHTEEESSDEIVFTPKQASAVGLELETVELAPFESVIKCTGQIVGAQGTTYSVVATSNGIINLPSTTLSLGHKIAKGQLVASIISNQILGGDMSSKVVAQYNKAHKEWQRALPLVAEKIISQKDFDQIELNYQTAQIAYQALGQNPSSSNGVGAKVNAPIAGYITELYVSNGSYVEQGALIATISQNERLELKVDVAQKWSLDLPKVHSANFRPSYSDRIYKLSEMDGRLLSYSQVTVSNSPYVSVTFSFLNRDGLVSGSYVDAYLLLQSSKNIISIPLSSLVENQGTYNVFVQLDAECYEKRHVVLGANNGDRVEILSGLSTGEKVVTKAAYQVKMAASSSVIPDGHNH